MWVIDFSSAVNMFTAKLQKTHQMKYLSHITYNVVDTQVNTAQHVDEDIVQLQAEYTSCYLLYEVQA